MKTIWKIVKIICALFAATIGTGFVLLCAWITWELSKPLPKIPSRKTAFTIKDLNIVKPVHTSIFRLTQKDEVSESHDLSLNSRASDNPSLSLVRVTKTSAYFLMENGSSRGNIELKKVAGYSKEVQDLYMNRMNWYGAAVGGAWLGRACDSPCEPAPHRRTMALLWKPGTNLAVDLNTLIDANSGWYLFYAIDINNKGQVLCWASNTDARGAEGWTKEQRLVLLTPVKVPPGLR